jgi:hypothetical protein
MTSQENIVHTTPAEAPPPLQIGIFFDGTGNGDEIKNKNKWSNVKYLYDMHQGDDELFDNKNYIKRKFYQRGVGSHEDDSDFYIDFESAMGAGAEKRFENVVFNIEKYINEYKIKFKTIPSLINLDVFGFSRGAAMARHFVNCIKQDYFDFDDIDINIGLSASNIKINFLGVFDTVGSFGIAGNNIDDGYSFYINPNWIENKAVHIFSLHEYRWGFDLQAMIPEQDTNYPIDIFKEKLVEIGLPGVHSDIGGSYAENTFEQANDNSLLACMALEKMAKYASENGVPLDSDYKDASRRNVSIDNKNFNHMKSSYDKVLPYIENNDLRLPIGLWREHIALKDIYLIKFENANKELDNAWTGDDDYEQVKSDVYDLDKDLRDINNKIDLSEKNLLTIIGSEVSFNELKANYDILYQDYMHRSHAPFNETPFMGKQDANENHWLWNKTISDERPHRDIFYNQLKDFEKSNNKMKRRANGKGSTKASPEFKILESIKWEDDTRV